MCFLVAMVVVGVNVRCCDVVLMVRVGTGCVVCDDCDLMVHVHALFVMLVSNRLDTGIPVYGR
jgi:hypothetical protein